MIRRSIRHQHSTRIQYDLLSPLAIGVLVRWYNYFAWRVRICELEQVAELISQRIASNRVAETALHIAHQGHFIQQLLVYTTAEPHHVHGDRKASIDCSVEVGHFSFEQLCTLSHACL